MDKKGAILLISGPSGSGKSSLCKELFNNIESIYFSISTTTREIREGEVDGKHYYFVSKESFLEDIEDDKFLEWAEVHGNLYGTSKKSVLEALESGKLVVFDIDVQGFINISKQFGKYLTSVFITTPSKETLKKRLHNRGTDNKDTIDRRVKHALEEMKFVGRYDYLLINDNFEKSSRDLISIARSAMLKTSTYDIEDFSKRWDF